MHDARIGLTDDAYGRMALCVAANSAAGIGTPYLSSAQALQDIYLSSVFPCHIHMAEAGEAAYAGRFLESGSSNLVRFCRQEIGTSSGRVTLSQGAALMAHDSAHLHELFTICFPDTNHHARPEGISDPVYGNRKRQLSSVNDPSGNDLYDASPVTSGPVNSSAMKFGVPVQGVPFSDTTEAKSIKAWLTASEIAAAKLPGLPFTARSVRRLAKRLYWHRSCDAEGRPLARQRRGRGGGLEYHISLLPLRARAVFIGRAAMEAGQAALKGKGDTSGARKPVSDTSGPDMLVSGTSTSDTCRYREMWAAFERLPEKARDISFGRLAVLTSIEMLVAEDGFMKDRAIRHMAQTKGLSRATLYIWFRRIRDVPREHWLPFLIDRRAGNYAGKYSGHSSGLHTIRGKQLNTGPCPQKHNDENHRGEDAGDREALFEPSPANQGAVDAGTLAVSRSPCMDRHKSNKRVGDAQPDKQSDQRFGFTGTSSNSISPHSAGLGTGAEDQEKHRSRRRACPEAAFDMLKADWLRNEKPSFMSCYRRLEAVAARKDWVLPCARSLYRQMMEDVPVATRVLLRDGPSALKRLYPAQQRYRSVFHAMEAVNADGHVWDVFVRWPGVKKPVRPVMVAIQDLYSGKVLAWRIGRRETTELVLLAFMDLIRDYGIPEHVWFDNGLAFRGKRLVGGLPQKQPRNNQAKEQAEKEANQQPLHNQASNGRCQKPLVSGSGGPKSHRSGLGQNPQHQAGLLTMLGVRVHRTLPYSGQSKPIERAFRDFCDTIAKHPLLAGAYTGNSPGDQPANYGNRAVPLELFLSVVEEGIREHNARPGRRTGVCGGRLSFDEAFDASFYGPGKTVAVRKATAEQRAFCLPSAVVRLDSLDGSLRLSFLSANPACVDAGANPCDGSRRYWAEALLEHRGSTVTVRFDPDHPESVRVYSRDGCFLCEAALLAPAGFNDTKAAGAHARARKAFIAETERQVGDVMPVG